MTDTANTQLTAPPAHAITRPKPSPKQRVRRRVILLLLLLAAFHLCLCGILAWETVRPKRNRITPTPASYPLAFENIAFRSQDNTMLRGWFLPATKQPRGLIICCHGVDSDRSDLLETAVILHKAGYAALLFDFRARGESEGRLCTLGYREVDDLLAAICYAQARPDLRQVPIGLLGESMGAAVALMGAARCPDVKAVIAESPFARLDHAVSNHFRSVFGFAAPLFAVPTRIIGQMLIGKSCADIAPVEEISRISPRPLLLIEDGSDKLCPPEETQALLAASGSPKQLWRVPNASHISSQSVAPDEYARRITGFFNTALPRQGVH